jgi:organic radical activating enzyme
MKTIPEIRDSFTEETLENILKKDYSSYVITGGEPFKGGHKLIKCIDAVYPTGKPIYMHTNGILINLDYFWHRWVLETITGINISLHENNRDLAKYERIVKEFPNLSVVLHVWEKLVDLKLTMFLASTGIKYKFWKLDDCRTVPEDRFILIDN